MTKAEAIGPPGIDHGMEAPRGGIPARLPRCHRPADVIERCGQATLTKKQALHDPGMPM